MSASEEKVRCGSSRGRTKPPRRSAKLNLGVEVAKKSACERHVTVTVSREDIERYFDNSYSELMGKAEVPGFRPGVLRASWSKPLPQGCWRPGENVAVHGQHDANLGGRQPVADQRARFRSCGRFDPEDGPMKFEFDIEVRPEFDLPKWQGLSIERATHEFNDAEVDKQLKDLLARRGRLVPFDGARSGRRLRHREPDVQERRRQRCLEHQGRNDSYPARS